MATQGSKTPFSPSWGAQSPQSHPSPSGSCVASPTLALLHLPLRLVLKNASRPFSLSDRHSFAWKKIISSCFSQQDHPPTPSPPQPALRDQQEVWNTLILEQHAIKSYVSPLRCSVSTVLALSLVRHVRRKGEETSSFFRVEHVLKSV